MCVQSILNEQESFGRIGGEEWLFILSNTTKEQSVLLFERLQHLLSLMNEKVDVGNYKVTASMGVAELTNNEGLQGLIKKADERLYDAKNQGRNRIVF